MSLQKDDLLGSWTLTSFTISYSDARKPRFPFGETPKGRLVYTDSGHMMALLCHELPCDFKPKRLEEGWKASESEKARAFDRSMSYSGRYRIDNNTVTHTVELAQNPAIIGTEQSRTAQLNDSTLTLSYSIETKSGATAFLELLWNKEDPH